MAKWIVLCDQPFDEVDKPEFREMMNYAHHPMPDLKIPHRDAIRRRILKMGDDSIESTRRFFEVRHSIDIKWCSYSSGVFFF